MQSTALRVIREEHGSLAAVLQSLRLMMMQKGAVDDHDSFFDAMRAMLFYIDEVPERQHHPKESELLFPPVMQHAPELKESLERLEADHEGGERAVRDLQHLLLAWELLGDSRREPFAKALESYITFYFEHMKLEETVIIPAAQKYFTDADWAAIDAAFASNHDPLAKEAKPEPIYERLFSRIVQNAPSPIGLGGRRSN